MRTKMTLKRNEYPRPQFKRDSWQSLNGEWEFEFDDGKTGVSRGIYAGQLQLAQKINVPFSYQYPASGIGDIAAHDVVWYRRKFTVNANKNALLCFNAADYETDVWINGIRALTHKGGFTPFKGDITKLLKDGENVIVVRCIDTADTAQPRGKQNWRDKPFSCFYTPNSGIWGSVWIEYFDGDCIDSYTLEADVDSHLLRGQIRTLYGVADKVEITVIFKDNVIKRQTVELNGKLTDFSINIPYADPFAYVDMLWSPDKPNLLYVDFKLTSGERVNDLTHTRIGLRKISIVNGKICLNDRPLFQRLVLDQGYWNESGLTPPSAEALKRDIELSKAMGFNGARKHQKLEDPYFYYYAEELGFLVWAEMPSAYTFCESEVANITREWQEAVGATRNFTSVIAYVPLNESWGARGIKTDIAQQNFAKSLYYLTKSLDNTRFISTNDGFENIEESDVLSIHDYNIKSAEEFPTKYNGNYDGMHPQGWALFADGHKYKGQPVLLTEFGGLAFADAKQGAAWGYGEGAKTDEEFYERLNRLIEGIAQTEFQGYCYTQLTDVQQEVNGLLNSDRSPKLDVEKLNAIFKNRG